MPVARQSVVLASALLLSIAAAARAEPFPQKPIEMTVLFGGSAQAVGQVLADQMSKALGSPVVAVSRTGAGGAIGYSYVKSQPADGYSIVWNSNSISTAHYQGNLAFDYQAFTPIARIGMEVPVLAVRKASGWKTLEDMAGAMKKSGSKLKIAAGGNGSFTYILAVALTRRLGLDAIYVPGGTGGEIAELLGGRVDAALRFPSEVKAQVEAGELVVLCTASKETVPLGLSAPTCDAAGATGLDMTMWRGLAAPAGTPPEVVKKLQDAAKTAVDTDAFKQAAGNLGFTVAYLPANKFGEVIARDDGEIAALMKDLRAKPKP
jgi:tripartite-type tricarboxylate transporter receptor subunit TctC